MLVCIRTGLTDSYSTTIRNQSPDIIPHSFREILQIAPASESHHQDFYLTNRLSSHLFPLHSFLFRWSKEAVETSHVCTAKWISKCHCRHDCRLHWSTLSATIELLQEHGTTGSSLICQSIQTVPWCSTKLRQHGKVSGNNGYHFTRNALLSIEQEPLK